MPTDRELEAQRRELSRQAAALYVAANDFARHLFESPGHGQRALLETRAGAVLGRQLGRFRSFMCATAPELAPIVEQLAAGDDLAAQLDALPAGILAELDSLPKPGRLDVAGQAPLFDGVAVEQLPAAIGLPDAQKRGGRR
jgi:hypothetical protein